MRMMLQAAGHTAAVPLLMASCPLLRRRPSAAVAASGPAAGPAPFAPGEGATVPLGPQFSKCLVNAASSKPCVREWGHGAITPPDACWVMRWRKQPPKRQRSSTQCMHALPVAVLCLGQGMMGLVEQQNPEEQLPNFCKVTFLSMQARLLDQLGGRGR